MSFSFQVPLTFPDCPPDANNNSDSDLSKPLATFPPTTTTTAPSLSTTSISDPLVTPSDPPLTLASDRVSKTSDDISDDFQDYNQFYKENLVKVDYQNQHHQDHQDHRDHLHQQHQEEFDKDAFNIGQYHKPVIVEEKSEGVKDSLVDIGGVDQQQAPLFGGYRCCEGSVCTCRRYDRLFTGLGYHHAAMVDNSAFYSPLVSGN